MIVNYEYLNGKLAISYINKRGNIEFKSFPMYNPTEWKVCSDRDPSKSDTYHTWDNKPVKQEIVRYPNRYTIYEFLRNLPAEDREEIFAYNEPKMFFCDIEVEITEGFPEAHIADNRITAICLINKNKILLMGIKELGSEDWIAKMEKDINNHFKDYGTEYTIQWDYYDTEKEMLHHFFNDLIKMMPVLTGWNFVGYDWVYFVTRARKLGINPNVASPTGKLIKPWKKNMDFGKPTFEELPIHRLVFDYMDIFDKWDTSIKVKESMSLDFVSSKVLGVKKLEYEGSLKDLYEKDYYKYLLYNCVDTALVQLIHNKQRTFDLMMAISNLAKIPMENALSAIRVTEGIFFDPYMSKGIVMVKQKAAASSFADPNSDVDEEAEDLAGGYVKYPVIGLKRWVTVMDFSSLYPTTMRQFNIAPESYKGLKISETESLLNGVKYTLAPDDIILLNNTVFKNEDSETKRVLTNIFDDRKKNKNLGIDHKHQAQLIKDYYKKRFNKEYK